MIISHKYKFIFLKTQKTASSSIEAYLSPYCGDNDILTPIYPAAKGHKPRNYDSSIIQGIDKLSPEEFSAIVKNCTYHNHMSALDVKRLIGPEIWNSYLVFCVERNPWDKVVSHYFMANARAENKFSFKEYVEKGQFPVDENKWLHEGEVIVDNIVRYEKLDSELAEVFDSLNIPFEHGLNIYEKSDLRKTSLEYHKYYEDEGMINAVRKHYHQYINLLEYSYK